MNNHESLESAIQKGGLFALYKKNNDNPSFIQLIFQEELSEQINEIITKIRESNRNIFLARIRRKFMGQKTDEYTIINEVSLS